MRRRGLIAAAALGACAALVATGCGGGSRQDAGELHRIYRLRLGAVSFQPKQSIAEPTALRISVSNPGPGAVPDVAVTIDSFSYVNNYPELASDKRPIWVIEQGPGTPASRPVQSQAVSPPGGGQTAYVNTWALGPLGAGATRTFEWKIVPVKAGEHVVHYRLSAGLAGNAKAAPAAGGKPLVGVLRAEVAPAPPARHVDPATGRVVAGQFPVVP